MPDNHKEILFHVFTRYAEQPALVSTRVTLTWKELYRQVIAAGKRLDTLGFKENDRVAILCDNHIEYIILCLALWRQGAVVVPLSVRWPRGLISGSLRVLACKKLLSDPNRFFFDAIIKYWPITDVIPGLSPLAQPEPGEINIKPEQDCTIMFTSGSCGTPKAVLHSWANHYYNALGSNQNIAFGPGDRWLLSLPLYHVGGMAIIFRALAGGGCIAVPDKKLSMEDNIKQLQVTHVSLVATQLYRLLQNDQVAGQLSGLKAMLLGGSAIPDTLVKAAYTRQLPIYTSYGSTEMASQITTTRPGDSLERLSTSGTLLPYRELVVNDHGEILVKGRSLCKGYVKKRLRECIDADGWYHSGDLGVIDEHGYLHVTGRKDNMFISGGENIYPEEIEAALLQQDNIIQALVVPAPDKEFGSRPAAFVQYRGAPPDFDIMRKTLAEYLPKFKIPVHIFDWPDGITSCNEKPDRKTFKKLLPGCLNSQTL
ncbi:MAG TPA: o-succinylbenzoate--CoA ligase [bacterium]|nr:o-succinylbenzoate--CoA ligase [bacterium]HPN44427.1 o-succinylbenzoate--CoA ligase [bacterium]